MNRTRKEQIMDKPIITKEVERALDYLFSKFSSNECYHGDSILCVIECVKEGMEIDNVTPIR